MAKKSNSALLGDILKELTILAKAAIDKAAKNINKKDDDGKSSLLSLTATKVTKLEALNMQMLSSSTAAIASAAASMSKIKKDDIKRVEEFVKTLVNIVKDVKIDKKEAEAFKDFMNTFVAMNNQMTAITDNFLKSFFKFSPIKAKIIGKRIAKFYKNIFKAFDDENVFEYLKGTTKGSASTFRAVMDSITKLFEADSKKLANVSKALGKFPENAGKNLAGFVAALVDVIVKPEYKLVFFDKNGTLAINRFALFLNVLSKLSIGVILTLFTASLLLGPKLGKKLGGFFEKLIEGVAKIDAKKVEAANKIIRGITLFILGAVITLALLVIIFKKFKLKYILSGLLIIAGMLAAVIGIMWILTLPAFKKMINTGIKTLAGIAIFLIGCTVALALAVWIAKTFKFIDIIAGLGIILVEILLCVGLIFLLSLKKVQRSVKESILVLGAMVLVLGLTALISLIFIGVGKHYEDILKGAGVTALVVLATIAIIWIASKISRSTLFKGLIVLAGVAAAILSLSLVMLAFVGLTKQLNKLSWKDIGDASLKILAVFGAIGVIIAGLGVIMDTGIGAGILIAGFAAFEMICGAILSLSLVMTTYAAMQTYVLKNINETNLTTFKELLVGKEGIPSAGDVNVIGILLAMIEALDGVKTTTMLKLPGISLGLYMLFSALEKFVDVIQKMATMQILEGYDGNGKPKYRRLTFDEFKKAATNLSESFSKFISELLNGFGKDSKNAELMKNILDALFPIDEGIIFNHEKPSIRTLFESLNSFVDVIAKMATMQIADGWDENGAPNHYVNVKSTDFLNAAINLTKAFTTFITELNNVFTTRKDAPSTKMIKDIIESLCGDGGSFFKRKKGTVIDLMDAIGTFANSIINIANMQIACEWDENGKPKSYLPQSEVNNAFATAAGTLVGAFTTFLTELKTKLDATSDNIKDIVEKLTNGGIKDLMEAIGNFIEPIMSLAAGYVQIGEKYINIYDKPFGKETTRIERAANTIPAIISAIITPLSTLEIDSEQVNLVVGAFNSLTGVVETAASCIKDENTTQNAIKAANTINSLEVLIGSMYIKYNGMTYIRPDLDRFKDFEAIMSCLAGGFNKLNEITFNNPQNILLTAIGLNRFDMLLLNNYKKRAEALENTRIDFNKTTLSAAALTMALRALKAAEDSLFSTQRTKDYENLAKALKELANVIQEAANTYKNAIADINNNLTNMPTMNVNLNNATDILTAISKALTNTTLHNAAGNVAYTVSA